MVALFDKLIRSDRRPLLVGLSGGLDSVVLLHALAATADSRQTGLRAIHVDHGLHADAGRWAIHCQRVCTALDVALTVVRVQVGRHGGEGLEAAARRARHLAFEAELRDNEVLTLAHHRDDQAETFLLRALRGSGPDGLGAMQPWRRFEGGWMWRPLLAVPRTALLAYAQRHGLQWIEDPSNADVGFDRNFLRHQVMPLLQERWPQADAALARSAALNAEACVLLDAEDAQLLAQVRGIDPRTLDIQALGLLPVPRRARVLRRWVAALSLPPLPAAGIAQIESQLLTARPDSRAEFAWAGAVIRCWHGLLHAGTQHDPLPADWRTSWDGASALKLPTGEWLRLESAATAVEPSLLGDGSKDSQASSALQIKKLAAEATPAFEQPVIVHARRGGERIALPGRNHTHALKHVLQELEVPPWVRARLPLLSDAHGALLAAGDLVYSAPFARWLRERDVQLLWKKAKG